VWGLYQGALLSIHAWRREKGRPPWPAGLGRLATLVALLVGWVILRSDSVGMALGLFGALIGRRGVEATPFALPGVDATFLFVLATALLLTSLRRDTSSLRPRESWAYAGVAAVLLVLCVLAMGRNVPFLYFQF
jgi:D-alanyl-lipoteichoic acid acyltransferase DltB (MBOAT superfamily)